MLADEFRLTNERIVRVLADPGFRRNRDPLIDSLKKSLECRDDGERLLYLQAELANSVIHAQAELRKIKRGDRQFDTPDAKSRFVDASSALVHVLRAIADGIAWRSLGYDRAGIHELAIAPQTGHMELETAIEEMTSAAEILTEDPTQIVILNDLTNFLRFGDVTIVQGSKVWIHEVKSGKASAGDRRATRQKQRLRQVIEVLNESGDSSIDGNHRLVRAPMRPKSYQEEVKHVLSLVRENGFASAQFSGAVAISAFDVDTVTQMNLSPTDVLDNPFAGARYLTPYNSGLFVGRFSPNVAPYSIFPFAAEDRIDLLMGRLVIVTWLDAEAVIGHARRRGLSARLPTKSDYDKLPRDLKPGQIRDHELDVAIEIGDRRNLMLLPMAALSRVGYEFLTEESFVDAIEDSLEHARSTEETFYQAFREEYWLWD